ncbi:MAG: TRAP transporter small permease, partial [Paracoccaceae bacterium]
RVLMAIVVFSVLPVLSAQGGHISVDLTDGLFARLRLSRARDVVLYCTSGVALLWPAQRVWILAERSRSYGDVTEYLNLPLFYMGWFIAASVTLTACVMILTGLMHLIAPRFMMETDA